MKNSFPPASRLHVPGEFASVFKARRVLRGNRFDLHYLPDVAASRDGVNGGDVRLGHARLGLVVPKRLAKSAVLRNAVKRQAREVFRQRREQLPPVDLVLKLAKSLADAKTVDPAQRLAWRTEIAALLDRLGDARGGRS